VDKTKIKNLLGSINYGVNIEVLQSIEALEKIYVKLNFYFKNNKLHEIIVDNFWALIQQLTIFWESDAKLPIFARRMAAWLSDYLIEIGYPKYDFQYVLDMINRVVAAKETDDKLVEMLGSADPEIRSRMTSLRLTLPEDDVAGFLQNELDKLVTLVPKTIESEIIYIDAAGKVSSVKSKQPIEKRKGKDSDIELTASMSFLNPLDAALHDVQINQIIPYDYKVVDATLSGFEKLEPNKKALDDGLHLTWTIPEIKPKAEVTIDVGLRRRVTRSILLRDQSKVDVIKTYFNIDPQESKFVARGTFANAIVPVLDDVLIEDQIPATFKMLEVDPSEDVYAFDAEKMDLLDNLVKWRYSKLPIKQDVKHKYTLLDRDFFLLDQYALKGEEGKPELKVVRLVEPNVIYDELVVSYYFRPTSGFIGEVFIKEKITSDSEVVFHQPSYLDRVVEVDGENVYQIWKKPRDCDEFGYIIQHFDLNQLVAAPISVYAPSAKNEKWTATASTVIRRRVFLPALHEYLEGFKLAKPEASP